MLRRALGLVVLIGVLAPASASAGVKTTLVGSFNAPTYIAAPAGDTDRLFVVQQSGQIKVVKGGLVQSTPFLDISSEVKFGGGEQGLLSMAFAPDYATTGRFYVYYTDTHCPQQPGCDERVSEFTASPGGDTASPASEHVLLTIPHPNESNHNGGQLQFGPDGDLYISVGDGGGGDDTELNAQRTDRLLGKLLRISPGPTSYTIPPDNPFSSVQSRCSGGSNGAAHCPEVWADGLRNPWRFSFDNVTGDLVIADVGQNRDEELDFVHPGQSIGANYGWPCYEGSERNATAPSAECSPLPSPVVAPVLSYPHPGNCAGQPFCGNGVIGGYVMHDPTLPSLDGCYVFGDLSTPDLQLVRLAQPSAVGQVDLGPQVSTLSSFGQDASGRLYAADIADGTVYRLDSDGNAASDPTCPNAPPAPGALHPPVNTSLPQVAGPPIPGARLTCVPGNWMGATSFTYAWLRDGAPRAGGVTYRPPVPDVGHRLACIVTAHNANGTATATSPTVRVVRIAPPLLFALRISPAAFTPARSGPSLVRGGARATTVTFRLDEPATVTFTVQRAVTGSRVKRHCRRSSPAHPHARACTLWRPVRGSFHVSAKRGLNRLRFSGRIGNRALAPGRYRLALRARDKARRLSEVVRGPFSTVR